MSISFSIHQTLYTVFLPNDIHTSLSDSCFSYSFIYTGTHTNQNHFEDIFHYRNKFHVTIVDITRQTISMFVQITEGKAETENFQEWKKNPLENHIERHC